MIVKSFFLLEEIKMSVTEISCPKDQSYAKITMENGDVLNCDIATLELMVNQKIANSEFSKLTSHDMVEKVTTAKKIMEFLKKHNFPYNRLERILQLYEKNIVN